MPFELALRCHNLRLGSSPHGHATQSTLPLTNTKYGLVQAALKPGAGSRCGCWCIPARSKCYLPAEAIAVWKWGSLQGVGSGVLEIAVASRSAWSMHLQRRADIWVIHAFQKKSTTGIKTPKRETDVVKDRLKRLKEMLK